VKVRLKALSLIFGCIFVPYVGSYLYLSEHGRYEPVSVSMAGIQWYGWAPEGFAQGGMLKRGKVIRRLKWDQHLMIAYLPLLFVDWKLWHQDIQPGEKTKYPVDEVIDSE
jgi:hypothetical protein